MIERKLVRLTGELLPKILIFLMLLNIAAPSLAFSQTYAFESTATDGSVRSGVYSSVYSSVYGQDEFDILRNKYFARLTGYDPDDPYDENDPAIKGAIAGIGGTAGKFWSTMDKSTYTWNDIKDTSLTSTLDLRQISNRLRAMSAGWAAYGSDYYHNPSLLQDIIQGLEWFYTHRYNETIIEYGNWYEWEISIPFDLGMTAILLFDQIPEDLKIRLMNAVANYTQPSVYLHKSSNATSTGANRVWKCKAVALRAIVMKDSAKLQEASDGLTDVFQYVTSGDGFYTDGSFIQHEGNPYAGGYGSGLIADISEMLWLLSGSRWDNTSPSRSHIFNWDFDTFETALFKGQIAASLSGRFVATPGNQLPTSGSAFIQALLLQIEMTDNPYTDRMKRIIKYHVENGYRDLFLRTSIWPMMKLRKIINDPAVGQEPEIIGNFQFYNEDRVIHRRPGWLFDAGLHSTRTKNYESVGDVNTKGFYQMDGATYFYMNPSDYALNYFYTVDPQRLPGITVDRDPTTPDMAGKNQYQKKSWVGGVNIGGLYGTVGMDFQQHHHPNNMNLQAKKSWFMFDDEVAALGTGITSTSGRTIETIVDNRFLNSRGDNTLTVDGIPKPSSIGWFENMQDVHWMHLDGMGGYVFPQPFDVNGMRERRAANLYDINKAEYSRAFDEFNKGIQERDWSWIREDPSHYAYTGSSVEMVTQPGTLAGTDNSTKNMLLAAAPPLDLAAETKLTFAPSEEGQEAGLIFYRDDDNYVYVSRGYWNGAKRIFAVSERNGVREVKAFDDSMTSVLYFKIEKVGHMYTFYAGSDGVHWGAGIYSIANDMAGPTGANTDLKMGLFAQNGLNVTASQAAASFDYFHFWNERNYLPLWIDHGVNPQNGSYSYITLPAKSPTEVQAYSSDPDLEIIRNDSSVQAVREKTLGITAAHFWNADTADSITSNNPAAVMIREQAGELAVSVSDPTHLQSKVTVEINKPASSIVSKDATVNVLQLSPTIKIEVDVSVTPGKTHQIVFDYGNPTPAASKWSDTFDAGVPDGAWGWVNEDRSGWSLSGRPGHMRIVTQKGGIKSNDKGQKNILLREPSYEDFEISTSLDFTPTDSNQSAGLIVFQDGDHYLKVSRSYGDGRKLVFEKETGGKTAKQTVDDTVTGQVYLKLTKSGTDYAAYYSGDNVRWMQIGIPYANVQLVHPKAGLSAHQNGNAPGTNADFDYFNITQTVVSGNDSFESATLSGKWSWLREDPDHWSLTAKPGFMRITAQPGELASGENNQKNILLQQPLYSDFEMTASLAFSPSGGGQTAGLIVYQDDDNYLKVSRGSGGSLEFVKETGGTAMKQTAADTAGAAVYLKLGKSGMDYSAYYSTNGVRWSRIGEGYKSVSLANPRVGVHAQAAAGEPVVYADFDDFTVSSSGTERGSDEFTPVLGAGWSWAREDADGWSLTDVPDYLKITADTGGLLYDENDQSNILLQTPLNNDFEVETRLSFDAGPGGQGDGAKTVQGAVYYANTVTDYFDSAVLDSKWTWVREDPAKWSLTAKPGSMTITTQAGDIWGMSANQRNLLLQTPQTNNIAIVTKLTFNPTQNWQSAGLLIYSDDGNYVRLTRSYNNGNELTFIKEINAIGIKQTTEDIPVSDIYLKLEKLGTTYTAYYSADGNEWIQVGSPYTGVDLQNMKVGLCAQNSGTAPSRNAYFDFFQTSKLINRTVTHDRGAGLILYSDDDNYIKLDRSYSSSGGITDNFDSTVLDGKWRWVREDKAKWSLAAQPGSMTITTQGGDIWGSNANQRNLLLQTPQTNDFAVATKLKFNPTQNWQTAGILIYADDGNYVRLTRSYNNGKQLTFVKEINAGGISQTAADIPESDIYLKLEKIGTTYTAYYSADGTDWKQLGSPYTGVVLPNIQAGLCAQNSGTAPSLNANFDYFQIVKIYDKSLVLIKETGDAVTKQEFMDTAGEFVYLKLVKAGSQVSAFCSSDGWNWRLLGLVTDVSLPNLKAGIQAQYHDNPPDGKDVLFDYFRVRY